MTSTRHSSILVLFAMALGLLGTDASANRAMGDSPICLKGVCFPKSAEVGDEVVPIKGMARYRYLIFDVYTVASYLPEEIADDEQALGDVPRSLILHYHRSISKEDFIKSTEELARKNPRNDMRAARQGLDRLYEIYEDVSEGDRYTITYEPGEGTTLALNGEVKGVIEGAEFSRALFGIWLSKDGVKADLSTKLLTGHGIP